MKFKKILFKQLKISNKNNNKISKNQTLKLKHIKFLKNNKITKNLLKNL